MGAGGGHGIKHRAERLGSESGGAGRDSPTGRRRSGRKCTIDPEYTADGRGQVMPQGYQTYGTFGYRTLGQSFVPSLSTFGGGIQTGPGGNFLSVGRSAGSAMFGTPLGQAGQQGAGGTPAAQPALNPGLVPGTIRQENMARPKRDWRCLLASSRQPLLRRTSGNMEWAGLPLRRRHAALRPFTPAFRPLNADRTIERHHGQQGNRRLPEQQCRPRTGAVHTPQDRVLLANVLALEPEVSLIDNRLVVEGSGTPASK